MQTSDGRAGALSGKANYVEVRDQPGVWKDLPAECPGLTMKFLFRGRWGGNAVLPSLPSWIHQRPLIGPTTLSTKYGEGDRSHSEGPLTNTGKWNHNFSSSGMTVTSRKCSLLRVFSPCLCLVTQGPSLPPHPPGLPGGSAQPLTWLQNMGYRAFVPRVFPLLGFELLKGRPGAHFCQSLAQDGHQEMFEK